MRLDEFRKQYPQYDGIPDENLAKALHEKYYSQIPFDRFSNIIGLAAPMAEEDVGTLRRVGDIGVGITQAIYGGVKALTDLFGANNPLSQAIGNQQELLSEALSAQAQGNLQRMQEISDEAKDKGTFDQLVAGLKAFGAAPVETMSQAFGSAIPIIAGGALANLTKIGLTGAGLTTGQAVGTQATLGAGIGAGMVKGQIYEVVKEELIKEGVDERVAEERAMEAQSYGGQNLDQILLAAGLGAGAALGPFESVLTKLVIGQPVKQASQNIVRNMVRAGLVEAVPEAVQAAQEQVAQNLALQREGMDVPTFRGVVTQATIEGIAGGALGAGTGVIGRRPALPTPPGAQPPSAQPPTAQPPEPTLGPEAPPGALPEGTPEIPPGEPETITPFAQGEFEEEAPLAAPAAPSAALPAAPPEVKREPIEEPPPMFGQPAPLSEDEIARRKEVKDLEAQQRTIGAPQKEENLFTVLDKKLDRQGLLKHKMDIPQSRMNKISAPKGKGRLLEDMIADGELDEFLPFGMRTAGLAGEISPDDLLEREQSGFEYMLDKLARNDPLTYENTLELRKIGYDLDQLTQEGKLNEVNRRLQEIANEELLGRTEAIAPPVSEERVVSPEGAPGTEAARQAAQQAGVAPSLFGEEEAKEPAAKIKAGLTRYASGMSGISDLETGAYTRAGYGRNGIGVDVSLLSKSATDALANAILNYRTPAFIDSGAFSAFRKQIKGQPVDPIDFDRVLAKYDEILTKIGELNPEERQDYPRPRFVMPDVVGDQDASVGLVNRYKNWIATEVRGNLSDPIVPIQKGPRSLSEVYDEISNILGTRNFIVGVPSQEEAISKADLAEFLKTSQPTKIHFLGAASDKKLNPLLALVAQHSPNTEVSADASKVRSSILSGVAQGKTREQAIQDALRAEDDPYEVFNRYMEQASAPQEAAPKETRAAPAAESDVDKLAEAFPNVPRDLFEGVGSFAKVKPYIQAAYNKGNLKQIETILNSLRKAAPPIGQVREPTPEEKRLADLERDLFRLTPPTTPELRAAPSAQADLFGVAGLESLPDRPQLQKQKRENNQQLSLFGSEVIDSSENNTAGRKARKAAIDEVKALQETDTTMGLSFADEFAKKQRANLVGQKINSASDLAVLSQVYRDPRFETFRLFFTDADNNVISQLGVTSRLPGSSNAIIGNDLNKYLVEVQKAAKDVGAVGFWMLHNHPSGNVQSSGADRVLTKTFNKYMPGMNFLGHVIIDTNKYGLILPDGTYTEISKDMNQKDLVDFQLGSYETVFNPIEMAKKVDEDQNAMVVVVMNNSLQVTGITSLPNSDFVGKTPEQIQRRLMKTALRGMGSRLLVASRNREALDAVASSVENGIHIKDNGQYENFNQMFKYRTILTFPLSRPGVVTADSSKLFDFLRKPKVADPGRSKYLNWTDLRVLEPQKEMFGDDVLSKLDKLPKDKSKLPPGRSPELAEITQRFVRGEVSRAERDEAVEKFKKVRVWEEVLEPATDEQMRNALNVVQRQKVNAPIPEGTKVGTRIDILAARKYGVQVVTIHEAKANVKSPMPGTAISYRNVAKLRNAKFAIGSEQKALDIAEGEKKDAIQTIEGYLVDITPAEAKREMEKALSDSEYIQIGFDPTAHSYFYDRVTKLPVISADEIIQIGNQVLAKGVEFQEAETFLYNITEDQGHLFAGEGVEKVDTVPSGVKKKVKKGRSPELAEMAEKLKRGEITKEDYDEAVNKFSRPAIYAEVPKPATDNAVVDALSSDKRPYANVAVPNGTKVGLRLDIPALERHGVGVVSIHQAKPSLTSPKADKILSYRSVGALKNVKFALGDQTKALDTAAGAFKDKLQTMEGEYINYTPEEAFAKAKEALNDPEYIQVGFNPIRHAYFYDRLTMLPVVSADEVIQIGQLVLAKNVEFGNKEDFLYSIGDPIARSEKEIDQSVGMTRQEIINFYQGIRQRRAALVKKVEKGEVSIDVQRRLQELNELGKEMQLDARIMYEPNLSARAFKHHAETAYLRDEISADVFGVLETMFTKYPKLLEGLQLSVKTDKTLGDAAGQFNPIKRLVTLYKDTSGAERPMTIRHEISHAMEQMMPIGAREAVIREWSKAFQAAIKKHKDAKSQEYFQRVLEFLDRPSKARMEAATRAMPSYDFYQYLNPSEYWAINAEKLMAAQLGTPWNRFVKAMKKLLEGMKKILGFNNKYTTHKTFDQIINGSMKRLDRGSLLDYMIEGDTDIDFLMDVKKVDDMMERYKRPDTPIETSDSVKDAFLGGAKRAKELAKDMRENPMMPISKMASNLDRAITYARNKNIWFGTGLNQEDFRRYNGQLKDGHNQIVASIAVDNALHAGHIGVQVAMLGKLKYDNKIGMFTAAQDKMSMQNVIKLKAKMVERLGAQRAANVINGYFEAKRSLSIMNEYYQREANYENALVVGDLAGPSPAQIAEAKAELESIEKAAEKVLMNDEEIDDFIALENTYPELREMMDNWTSVNRNLLDNMYFAQIINKKRYERLKAIKDYVPWYRITDDMEDIHKPTAGAIRGLTNVAKEKLFRKGVPKVTREVISTDGQQDFDIRMNPDAEVFVNGAKVDASRYELRADRTLRFKEPLQKNATVKVIQDRPIDDIVDNMLNNVMMTTKNVMRNYANLKVVNTYGTRNDKGKIRVFSQEGADEDGVRFNILSNGKRIVVQIKDPLIAESVLGLENLELPVNGMLSYFANGFRRSITAFPAFQLKQLFMDAPSAAWVSGVQNPIELWTRVFSSFVAALNPNDPITQILRSKGIGGFQSAFRSPQKELELEIGLVKGNMFAQAMRVLDRIGDASDIAQRRAIYMQIMKETGDETLALSQAQNVIDFLRRGSGTPAQFVTRTVAFANAYAQSVDVLARTIAGGGLKGKSRRQAQALMMKTAMKLGVVTVLYCMAVGDDEEYQKLDDQTRARGFFIPGSKEVFGESLVLPMSTGASFFFKTLPEIAYNQIMREGTESKMDETRLRKALSTAAVDSLLGPNMTPTAVKPFIEIALNRNFFTGTNLIPRGMEDVEAAQQYNATTSELGKTVSALTSVPGTEKRLLAPMEADHLMRSLFGTVAATAMWGTNLLTEERVDSRMKDNPMYGPFFLPPVGRGREDMFYDLKDRVDKKYETYELMIERGQDDAAESYYEKHADLIDQRELTEEIVRSLQEVNSEIRLIGTMADPEYKKAERTKDVRELQEEKNDILEEIAEIRKEAGL